MSNKVSIKRKKKIKFGQIGLHTFYVLTSLTYILPLLLMVSISVSGKEITKYKFIPDEVSFFAYELIFKKPEQLLKAYGVTAFYCIAGVILGISVMAMCAYALSRKNFVLRGALNKFMLVSILFSGGTIPTYILISKYFHMNETIWVYIIPWLVSTWTIILMKTFFMNLPNELFEAARIDGASELRICFNIAMPLSTPIIVTQAYAKFLGGWNDWKTCSIYIRKNLDLWSLQFLVKQYMDKSDMTASLYMAAQGGGMTDTANYVSMHETVMFAMAIMGIGPAFLVFPLIQKHYEKGLVVGSVKG